ncbi:MAG: DUF5989 family protein [Ignavibacteriales bacterium]|nr:hypothetical protein [Ignavibacteria bacterium]MBZ0197900.1 DUF5989 family protein [Ignavibacteriaceae bacterium]MCZ2142935.1 DUF5989 family protein [Ignavibacteriales bacterium]WKZ72041.1 MAG: DUF5989 family protein [Ignavibacteriaceae bacterium]
MSKIRIISQYFAFLKEQKKWWLIPVVVLIIFIGLVLVFAKSSPLAPFIYTLF